VGDDYLLSDRLQCCECFGVDDNSVVLCLLVWVNHVLGDRSYLIKFGIGRVKY